MTTFVMLNTDSAKEFIAAKMPSRNLGFGFVLVVLTFVVNRYWPQACLAGTDLTGWGILQICLFTYASLLVGLSIVWAVSSSIFIVISFGLQIIVPTVTPRLPRLVASILLGLSVTIVMFRYWLPYAQYNVLSSDVAQSHKAEESAEWKLREEITQRRQSQYAIVSFEDTPIYNAEKKIQGISVDLTVQSSVPERAYISLILLNTMGASLAFYTQVADSQVVELSSEPTHVTFDFEVDPQEMKWFRVEQWAGKVLVGPAGLGGFGKGVVFSGAHTMGGWDGALQVPIYFDGKLKTKVYQRSEFIP